MTVLETYHLFAGSEIDRCGRCVSVMSNVASACLGWVVAVACSAEARPSRPYTDPSYRPSRHWRRFCTIAALLSFRLAPTSSCPSRFSHCHLRRSPSWRRPNSLVVPYRFWSERRPWRRCRLPASRRLIGSFHQGRTWSDQGVEDEKADQLQLGSGNRRLNGHKRSTTEKAATRHSRRSTAISLCLEAGIQILSWFETLQHFPKLPLSVGI